MSLGNAALSLPAIGSIHGTVGGARVDGGHGRLGLLQLLRLAACVAMLLAPASAGAQEGPQFGNWGPGMPPPDQEGFDPGAQSGTASPYYGAPAPGGVAPAPYAGCQYDLRGTWWNDGRQTTGGYRPYSAYVYVRQYRTWIQAQQDDGTGGTLLRL